MSKAEKLTGYATWGCQRNATVEAEKMLAIIEVHGTIGLEQNV